MHAIRKGNVSLTPITLDCTAPVANEELNRSSRSLPANTPGATARRHELQYGGIING